MKKTFLALLSIAILGCGTLALAASTNGNGNANAANGSDSLNSSGNGNASSGANSVTTETQTQAQTQTNNPGTGVMTQAQAEVQLQERIQESKPVYSPKNEQAQERMSAVATAAEYLIRVAERLSNTGIGDQIRTIARTQSQNQDRINQSIDNVDKRTALAKYFIGTNYSELKNIQTLMDQNKTQVQELEQLMTQMTVEADKLEIAKQIIVLQNQQLELRDQVKEMASGFSFFGWINRWYNKY